MTNMNDKKGVHLSVSSGAVALALTVLGAILFFMSYRTGYYIFGQMNSNVITALLCVAMLLQAAALWVYTKKSQGMIAKLMPFFITALLAATAMMILGDRVEGIGNCIITDYDSGHGGEEAIYMSLIGAVLLLVAMIYNIIGAFTESGSAPAGKKKTLGMIISGAALGVCALIATVMLAGSPATSGTGGAAGGAAAGGASVGSGTYTISFNQNNGNVDTEVMPTYQFLSADMGGLARADGRLYIDMSLTLDGQGAYTVVSDCYVVDSGKRAEIGDPSGLALIYKTTSEGSYTDNGDGTVTTATADHVQLELATDTYSEQMKSMMQLDFGGSDADGTYDSADYPEMLEYAPETVWTLSEGTIVSYGQPGLKGAYTISFNQNNGNTDNDVMPTYQFLSADVSGLARADARLYVDVVLNLDGVDGYTVTSDCYVFDSGKRVEIGDPSGLALIYKTTCEGKYTDNGDDTVTTGPAEHVHLEIQTDTYSEQMKSMMALDFNGSDADGEYDSADYPDMLDYAPETIWTLDSAAGTVVTYESTETEEEEEKASEEEAAPAEALTITSDDGSTTMTFNPDGTYLFAFESYNIQDPGTWTYADGKLTVTNANGDVAEAEGDPLKLHYVSSMSPDLAGDFTINAADISFESAGGASAEPVTVASDDGSTAMTFNPDGTYVFVFESYNIQDPGTWTYADGKLTVTNANGDVAEAEGDPLKLHYVSSMSPDLAGDYTIPAASFAG